MLKMSQINHIRDLSKCGYKVSEIYRETGVDHIQIFGGETAECVCQGLQDIFEYIGGVPEELVFDNATGVGRRVHDKVTETAFFSRFRAHYGFRICFCNPEAGYDHLQ